MLLSSLMTLSLLGLIGLPSNAADATLGGASTVSYTEQQAAITLLPDLTIGGGPFDSESIEFAVNSASGDEDLSIPEVASIGDVSTVSGEVSVLNGTAYVGQGSGEFALLGVVDSVNNGQNGQPLKINFSSAFTNAGFEEASSGTRISSIAGWSGQENVIVPGTTQFNISGSNYTVPVTWDPWTPSSGECSSITLSNDTVYLDKSTEDTHTVSVTTGDKTEGSNSLLLSSGGDVDEGCAVRFGPAAWSDSFTAEAGQNLSFEWRSSSSDNIQILAYLVKLDGSVNSGSWSTRQVSGNWIELLDEHGDSSGVTTGWATENISIGENGTYSFVFIAGTQDYTGFRGVGVTMYIDNLQVVGDKATASAVQALARQVTYFNGSDNPPASQTITVTATPNAGAQAVLNPASTINITAIDDPPTITDTLINTNVTKDSSDPVVATGTLSSNDPDSNQLTTIDSGITENNTLGGITYDQKIDTAVGTFYLKSDTAQYRIESAFSNFHSITSPISDAIDLTVTGDSVTAQTNLTLRFTPTGVPGAVENLRVELVSGTPTLLWDDPLFFGQAAITNYKVEYDADGAGVGAYSTLTSGTLTDRSFVLQEVSDGTKRWRVSAVSSAGDGDASEITPPAAFVVSYDAGTGGSSPPSNQSASLGQSVVLSDGTGMTNSDGLRGLVGFSDGTQVLDPGSTFTPPADTTLTAIWESKITYDPNTATGTINPEYGYVDLTLNSGVDFKKPGFIIDEWNTQDDGDGVSYPVGSVQTFTSDTTLFAIWIIDPTPPSYAGPIISGVSKGSVIQATGEQNATVFGERLGTVRRAIIDGREVKILSTSNDQLRVVLPAGLAAGTYDLEIQSPIGNLTYLDAITISPQSTDSSPIEFAEVSAWTKRVSDSQVKVYVKFPTVGEKVRISHQTGGSGSYESVYVKTTYSETMEGLRIVEGVGTYIVRTIDLTEINRIRVTVGDQTLVQIRYNQ